MIFAICLSVFCDFFVRFSIFRASRTYLDQRGSKMLQIRPNKSEFRSADSHFLIFGGSGVPTAHVVWLHQIMIQPNHMCAVDTRTTWEQL